ncbi:signal recognition particle receptor subunit beta [Condylostylus longicornis]|uniref:signal recognition particle receptor subunit beta n=1 Tax=Condylostylus longicornis TaxID=2530218 RepID=UPI00244DCD85|nr:signal recognition particle receptor subunit beta [Condylostylus longicornis]
MEKETKIEDQKYVFKIGDFEITPVIIGILAVLFTIVLLYLYKKSKSSKTDFLLTGLCDSGKTFVFSQLLYSKAVSTFTSIAENIGEYNCGKCIVRVIDIPGNERLRSKFFEKYKNNAKGIVFVVDSVTFQRDVRDVADYLYTILADNTISKCPMLILCNKQDETMAKGCAVIKNLLEKEMNLVRTTRTSQLKSVDNTDSNNVYLGKQGKDFEFVQLPQKIEFYECSAQNQELSQLSDWIDRVV